MPDTEISGEVQPAVGQANRAAMTLQRLGFRVLHIGPTISVSAPQPLWEATFNVTFKPERKTVMAETRSEVTYQKAQVDTIGIPDPLRTVMESVVVVEPPEFF